MQKNEMIMDETKRIEKELKDKFILDYLSKLLEEPNEPNEPNEKKISWQERDYNEGNTFIGYT